MENENQLSSYGEEKTFHIGKAYELVIYTKERDSKNSIISGLLETVNYKGEEVHYFVTKEKHGVSQRNLLSFNESWSNGYAYATVDEAFRIVERTKDKLKVKEVLDSFELERIANHIKEGSPTSLLRALQKRD